MEQVRAVVIGFGGMGSQYAELIRDGKIAGMTLAGICCRNAKGQAVIRAEYPGVAVYRDVDDTFAHEGEFDAVIIVTPHATHVEIGKKAFAAGKHVLCDKPAGVSVQEVNGLLEANRKAGTSFAMMFNCRVAPSFARAKEIVDSGKLGRVTRAVWVCNNWFRTTCYHKSAPWRSSWAGEHGGLLINQCQHYLDLWQWILGMPDRLDADIDFGKYNDFDVDDSVDIRFLYENGLRGSFLSASGENPGVNRFEIWGTGGMLSIEGNEKLTLKVNEMETTRFMKENTEIYGNLPFTTEEMAFQQEDNAYRLMLQNFADHLLRGVPLIAPGEEGLKSVELANASYLSAWTGQKVELPIDMDVYERLLRIKCNSSDGTSS